MEVVVRVGTLREEAIARQKQAALIVTDVVEQLRNLGFDVRYQHDVYRSGKFELYVQGVPTPPPAWKLVEQLIAETAREEA